MRLGEVKLSSSLTMDNHSPASGEEADDHIVRKFMKDAERRYERHIQIMHLVGRFMKDANIIKKERIIILSSSY